MTEKEIFDELWSSTKLFYNYINLNAVPCLSESEVVFKTKSDSAFITFW